MNFGALLTKSNIRLKLLMNKLMREKGIEITLEQYLILRILKQNDGIRQSEIGVLGLKDKTNVTRMISLLEKKGYLDRKISQDDSRVNNVYIKEKGLSAVMLVEPISDIVLSQALSGINKHDQQKLEFLMKKVYDNLA